MSNIPPAESGSPTGVFNVFSSEPLWRPIWEIGYGDDFVIDLVLAILSVIIVVGVGIGLGIT
jgi:hypothetical protein